MVASKSKLSFAYQKLYENILKFFFIKKNFFGSVIINLSIQELFLLTALFLRFFSPFFLFFLPAFRAFLAKRLASRRFSR